MKEITKAKDVFELMCESLKDMEQEYCIAITVNNANILQGIHWISCGTDTSVTISNKMIAKKAVCDNASGVILVHNHPSGNPKPSIADIKSTEELRNGLDFLDISLMDHVIIAGDKFYSFVEN